MRSFTLLVFVVEVVVVATTAGASGAGDDVLTPLLYALDAIAAAVVILWEGAAVLVAISISSTASSSDRKSGLSFL